ATPATAAPRGPPRRRPPPGSRPRPASTAPCAGPPCTSAGRDTAALCPGRALRAWPCPGPGPPRSASFSPRLRSFDQYLQGLGVDEAVPVVDQDFEPVLAGGQAVLQRVRPRTVAAAGQLAAHPEEDGRRHDPR